MQALRFGFDAAAVVDNNRPFSAWTHIPSYAVSSVPNTESLFWRFHKTQANLQIVSWALLFRYSGGELPFCFLGMPHTSLDLLSWNILEGRHRFGSENANYPDCDSVAQLLLLTELVLMMVFLIDGDAASKLCIFNIDFSNFPALFTQTTLISDDHLIISAR